MRCLVKASKPLLSLMSVGSENFRPRNWTPKGMPGFDVINPESPWLPENGDLEQAKTLMDQAQNPKKNITLLLNEAPGHREILLGPRPHRTAAAADLSRIHVPTLVMFGQDDRLIPPADAEKFHKAIPAATLILYPGVGHLPMEQIPERSAADLKAWLAAHPAWAKG